jgi:hypothetical protein
LRGPFDRCVADELDFGLRACIGSDRVGDVLAVRSAGRGVGALKRREVSAIQLARHVVQEAALLVLAKPGAGQQAPWGRHLGGELVQLPVLLQLVDHLAGVRPVELGQLVGDRRDVVVGEAEEYAVAAELVLDGAHRIGLCGLVLGGRRRKLDVGRGVDVSHGGRVFGRWSACLSGGGAGVGPLRHWLRIRPRFCATPRVLQRQPEPRRLRRLAPIRSAICLCGTDSRDRSNHDDSSTWLSSAPDMIEQPV